MVPQVLLLLELLVLVVESMELEREIKDNECHQLSGKKHWYQVSHRVNGIAYHFIEDAEASNQLVSNHGAEPNSLYSLVNN